MLTLNHYEIWEPLLKWMNDENISGSTAHKHKGALSVCQDESKEFLSTILPDPPAEKGGSNTSTNIFFDWSNDNNCSRVNNAVIGAIPHHPFIQAIAKKRRVKFVWQNSSF